MVGLEQKWLSFNLILNKNFPVFEYYEQMFYIDDLMKGKIFEKDKNKKVDFEHLSKIKFYQNGTLPVNRFLLSKMCLFQDGYRWIIFW